jgi:hypothetical protein
VTHPCFSRQLLTTKVTTPEDPAVFQRFPQYYCIRNIISDFRNYLYGFRNIMSAFRNVCYVSRCSSTPRVQYHSIWGITPSRVHSCQLSRSCEFTGGLWPCRESSGGYCAVQGVFGGLICRAGCLRGDPQHLGFFYSLVYRIGILLPYLGFRV